ncbi:MAG: NADH dehydrogenase (quinone) subunit D [bacterium]|nr:NADH-quinone oxidoreductase subunit D [bacterium]MBU1916734.1 NADH-quinone oxidoreductase subunit D [bacterium]
MNSNLAQNIECLETDGAPLIVNMGPSHPAFHGALRTQVYLDGETIVKAKSEIGYLHRCFEKHSENSCYQNVIPYTDRLNYVSSLMNNVGYCKAVEDLMGVVVPDRAIIVRVLICELSRVIDHLVCVGTNLVDLGALTNFWYTFNVREKVYDFIEKISGARLTYSYTRIGGLSRDLYSGYEKDLKILISEMRQAIRDVKGLVLKNRIFLDRTRDVCVVSKKQALDWGFTGPCLRASGVPFDLRKAEPYYYYETFDFDIPVGEVGDTYDRIMVRFEEMDQSLHIMEQCIARMPKGPIMTDDKRVRLPAKQEVYTNIEALMNHFKIVMHGIKPPKGEIYSRTEVANGELGFYLISDGSMNPYRLKVRPPCFYMFAAFEHMIKGYMIADAVATLGSLNVVVGESDR